MYARTLRGVLSVHLHTFAERNARSRGVGEEPDYTPGGPGGNTRRITTEPNRARGGTARSDRETSSIGRDDE